MEIHQKQDAVIKEIMEGEMFQEIKVQNLDPEAVYVDFAPDKVLSHLLNFSQLNYVEKKSYASNFSEVIESVKNWTDYLETIIKNIVNDTDQIQQIFLTQIYPLTNQMISQPNGYQLVIKNVVPALCKLLYSDNMEIKEEAGKQITLIADFLTEEDRGRYFLKEILGMAHDDDLEDNRIVAVQLLSKMADCFGKDLCEQFIGLEFLSLGVDPQFKVRIQAVINLTSIQKVVSQNFYNMKLFPFFQKVSLDIEWMVRKAAVEIIVQIAENSDNELRCTQISQLMLTFLEDKNKWVKIQAYKQLGQFIYTLNNLAYNPALINQFLKMAEPSIQNLSNDSEILAACAYNFPAVLSVVGMKKWHNFKPLYNYLLESNVRKVRIPLASSLHEVAKIIGPENASKDLIQVLEKFLNDKCEEVKHKTIKNLANFISIFNKKDRDSLIDYYLTIQKNPIKWRVRKYIAQQIETLCSIYDSETVFKYIVPISLKLCNDTVSQVRRKAANKMYPIVLSMLINEDESTKESYLQCVIDQIKGFSSSERYSQRQSFVMMSENLMNYDQIYDQYFASTLINMATDKVVNVRILIAQIIVSHWVKKSKVCEYEFFRKIVQILRQDHFQDIQNEIQKIEADQFKKINNVESNQQDNQIHLTLNDINNDQYLDVDQILNEVIQSEIEQMDNDENNNKLLNNDEINQNNETQQIVNNDNNKNQDDHILNNLDIKNEIIYKDADQNQNDIQKKENLDITNEIVNKDNDDDVLKIDGVKDTNDNKNIDDHLKIDNYESTQDCQKNEIDVQIDDNRNDNDKQLDHDLNCDDKDNQIIVHESVKDIEDLSPNIDQINEINNEQQNPKQNDIPLISENQQN